MASIFAETLRALAPLFFLMVLGTALRRSGMLRAEHVPVLNGIVVNVTLPALVVHSLATAPNVPRETLWLPLVILIGELAVMAIALGIARATRSTRSRAGALMLVGAFGNTGFLGYPITLALFPHQFTAAILVDQVGMGIALFVSAPILGALLAPATLPAPQTELEAAASPGVGSQSTPSTLPEPPDHLPATPRQQALRNIVAFFRSPLFIAMTLGIVIRLISWPQAFVHNIQDNGVGDVVAHCLTYLGQGTVPLIMLSMGAALRPQAARVGAAPLLTASVLKLAVLPLIMWQLLRLLGVHGDILTVGVMLAAMPTAVMASVLSTHNGFDSDYSVGTVFVTTVLSAATLPLWIMIAR